MRAEERAEPPGVTPHLRIPNLLLGAAGGVVLGAALSATIEHSVVPLLLGVALLVTAGIGSLVAGSAPSDAAADDGLRFAPVLGAQTDWWRHYALEFERARRYDHPLALVSIACPRGADPDAVVGLIATHLRRLDSAWIDAHRVLVLLPESDRTRAEALVGRLIALEPEVVVLDHVRLAAFPEDALTSAALLDRVAAPGMLALDPGGGTAVVPERLRRVAHLAREVSDRRTSDPAA